MYLPIFRALSVMIRRSVLFLKYRYQNTELYMLPADVSRDVNLIKTPENDIVNLHRIGRRKRRPEKISFQIRIFSLVINKIFCNRQLYVYNLNTSGTIVDCVTVGITSYTGTLLVRSRYRCNTFYHMLSFTSDSSEIYF